MSDLTILESTGEVVDRAPLVKTDSGKWHCPYCHECYPAMRVTTRGRMDLVEAIEHGLAIPICSACGGVWQDEPVEVVCVMTGRVVEGIAVPAGASPTADDPLNLTGVQVLDVREISVNEWHPEPDGKGKPEQVHLWIEVERFPHPVVARFKSGKAMDELIAALITHRRAVFGGSQ